MKSVHFFSIDKEINLIGIETLAKVFLEFASNLN